MLSGECSAPDILATDFVFIFLAAKVKGHACWTNSRLNLESFFSLTLIHLLVGKKNY